MVKYKIKFRKNKLIKKEDYAEPNGTMTENNKLEFKFDKKTNVVPKKKGNKLLCIFFSEDKKTFFIWRKYNPFKTDDKTDFFIFKKGMYIIDSSGIHITNNNIRVAFYMEGISTPIKMSNIKKVSKKVQYTDLTGKIKNGIIQVIKGLEFDAKIMYIFLNRRFAEIFTKKKIKVMDYYILLIGIGTMIVASIGCVISYAFR